MSVFSFGVGVWGSAHNSKYLSQTDSFLRRAFMFGYTREFISIVEVIKSCDIKIWSRIINVPIYT